MYRQLLFTHLVISRMKYQQVARKPKRVQLPVFPQGDFREYHNHSVCHNYLCSQKCATVVEAFICFMIARPKTARNFSSGLCTPSPNLPVRIQVNALTNERNRKYNIPHTSHRCHQHLTCRKMIHAIQGEVFTPTCIEV